MNKHHLNTKKYVKINKFDNPSKGFILIKESYKKSEVTGGEWIDNLRFTNTSNKLVKEAVKLFIQWDYEDPDAVFSFLFNDFIQNLSSNLWIDDKTITHFFTSFYDYYIKFGFAKLIKLVQDKNKLFDL